MVPDFVAEIVKAEAAAAKGLSRFRCEMRDTTDKNSSAKFVRAKSAQEAAEISKNIWGQSVVSIAHDGPATI